MTIIAATTEALSQCSMSNFSWLLPPETSPPVPIAPVSRYLLPGCGMIVAFYLGQLLWALGLLMGTALVPKQGFGSRARLGLT